MKWPIVWKYKGEWGDTWYLRFKGFQKPQFLAKINKIWQNKHYLSGNVTTRYNNDINGFKSL